MNDAPSRKRYSGKYWDVPAFLDYVQPPLTDAVIAAAEKQLGVRLPATYLALLREQNGGYLRASWPGSVSRTLFGIGPGFASITRDGAWWRPKNASEGAWAPAAPDLLIPFDGDGHWDVCFDYRAHGVSHEPAVTFVDNECEREETIAESFAEYLARFVDEEAETAIRVYGRVTPETVTRRLAKHLGVGAPTMDAWAHGHPIWRIALPGKSQWCWASANLVPAGFRREGKGANTRVVVTDEMVLRIPEDPECAVLMSSTAGSASVIASALVALETTTRGGGENR